MLPKSQLPVGESESCSKLDAWMYFRLDRLDYEWYQISDVAPKENSLTNDLKYLYKIKQYKCNYVKVYSTKSMWQWRQKHVLLYHNIIHRCQPKFLNCILHMMLATHNAYFKFWLMLWRDRRKWCLENGFIKTSSSIIT